jgi:pentatricopeptide repeat protein
MKSLIHPNKKKKRLNEVDRLFNRIKESGLFPDMFNGFCKSGRLDEAYALL